LDDLDFPEPVAAPAPAQQPPRRRWGGLLVPSLGLLISVLFLSEERASLAYYLTLSGPVDLGAPGGYDLGAAREEIFARIRGDLGGTLVPYRRGWERRDLAPRAAPSRSRGACSGTISCRSSAG
jgi:hypothetical protein